MILGSVAQIVVDEVTERLGHNINIMDASGTIVASGDPDRIGVRHEAACRVLEARAAVAVTAEEASQLGGTHAGVNLPIVIQGELLGVVGVTGDPEQVGAAAASVLITVELMLAQEASHAEWQWRQNARAHLIEDLADGHASRHDWDHRCDVVGCHLEPPFLVLATRLNRTPPPIQVRSQLAFNEQGILVALDVENVLWLIADRRHHELALTRLRGIRQLLARRNVSGPLIDAGIAADVDALSDLVQRVRLTGTTPIDRDHSLHELELSVLLARLAPEIAAASVERLLGPLNTELTRTLEAFLSADLNITRAATSLRIHRNTMIRRLERINRRSGRDPRRFSDASALHVGLLLRSVAEAGQPAPLTGKDVPIFGAD